MGINVGNTKIDSIYYGNTPVKEVYVGTTKVRPPFKPRTFTISRTEKSDMSSGWTYSDDAAGLTAGDTAFDEFFGYYGCRLNASGVETAKITQEESGGAGKLDITQLGTLTSGDNVMICFPKRGIKMTKSGTTVTLSITNEENKSGYQYYAFNKNGTIKNQFYLGAYKASKIKENGTQYLRSYAGQSAAANAAGDGISYISLDNACTLAQKNSGYDEMTWYQRQYINAMYMMKYGNPNSQSVVGPGFTGGSAAQQTGITDSVSTATGHTGSNSNTDRIKLFGLEDWWGNVFEWMNGAYYSSHTNLQTSTTQAFTSGKITSFDTDTTVARNNYIQSINGNNTGMFSASAVQSSSTSYYCDTFNTYSGLSLRAGGYRAYGDRAGAFYVNVDGASNANDYCGARLMFL